MVLEAFDFHTLRNSLSPRAEWRPFPPAADREAWDALLADPLNQERRDLLVARAEQMIAEPWPAMPASLYMEMARSGNRVAHEKPYMQRRRRLATCVFAECFEHRGRFLQDIIDGIWLICEETTWTISAHGYKRPLRDGQDPLPATTEETLALFSAQTAFELAEADYLLAAELEAISPALRERVRLQIDQRIFQTLERHDDRSQRWLSGKGNWTPWMCSSILGAAMYQIEDVERLSAIALRLADGVERFIGHYGPDGGCNEGPQYWGVAAGAMLIFLELLYERSKGAIDVYHVPLIREMGLYVSRMQLTGDYFANFADAGPRLRVRRGITWRFGERVRAPQLCALVASQMRGWRADGAIEPAIGNGGGNGQMIDLAREIFWLPSDLPALDYRAEAVVWLHDVQVMVSRDDGLVLAGKAGHNQENHNHNDLGQFIIALDGEAVIIDPGTGIYTATTFGRDRYTLWTHRSQGHNVPIIDGYEQAPGAAHHASEVSFTEYDDARELSMELRAAYPEATPIRSLKRSIAHRLGEQPTIQVRDRLHADGSCTWEMNLLSPKQPAIERGGRIVFPVGERSLVLHYDPETIAADLQIQALDDPKLSAEWGEQLHRIVLTADGAADLDLRFVVEDR